MVKQASGRCYWTYDPDDEYRMTFISRCPDGSEKPLLTFRADELNKFLACAVLVGEHQEQWDRWREIAERDGLEALEQAIWSNHTTEYFENVIDVTFAAHPTRMKAITVSIHMLPERRLDLISHRFKSARARDRFMDWARTANQGQRLGLCLVGLLEGTRELATWMEKIARHHVPFGERIMAAVQAAIENGSDEAFIP